MSIKLYNGYKLPAMSLKELDVFCKKVRDRISSAIAEKSSLLGHRLLTELFDKIWFDLDFKQDYGNYIENNSIMFTIREHINNEQSKINTTRRRNPDYDFGFNFTVFVLDDKILCLLYTEQKSFTKIWESFCEVSEYGYWNNYDKPKSLTNTEWEDREKDWYSIIGESGIPALSGFSVECHNCILEKSITDFDQKHIPSVEDRQSYIRQVIIDKYFLDNVYKKSGDEFRYSDFINQYNNFKESKNIKSIIETSNEMIKHNIKKELDKSDFSLTQSEIINYRNILHRDFI